MKRRFLNIMGVLAVAVFMLPLTANSAATARSEWMRGYVKMENGDRNAAGNPQEALGQFIQPFPCHRLAVCEFLPTIRQPKRNHIRTPFGILSAQTTESRHRLTVAVNRLHKFIHRPMAIAFGHGRIRRHPLRFSRGW